MRLLQLVNTKNIENSAKLRPESKIRSESSSCNSLVVLKKFLVVRSNLSFQIQSSRLVGALNMTGMLPR